MDTLFRIWSEWGCYSFLWPWPASGLLFFQILTKTGGNWHSSQRNLEVIYCADTLERKVFWHLSWVTLKKTVGIWNDYFKFLTMYYVKWFSQERISVHGKLSLLTFLGEGVSSDCCPDWLPPWWPSGVKRLNFPFLSPPSKEDIGLKYGPLTTQALFDFLC